MQRLIGFSLLALALSNLGCGWSPLEVSSNQDVARETLIAALDAWKDGQISSLSKRNPPIRFADDDMLSGWQLMEYDLDDSADRIQPFKNVSVELLLRHARGQTIEKVVTYQIAVTPRLAVLRSDN